MQRRTLLAVLPVLALSPVRAQTVVYRCGPEGRSYSQQPCRDGVAMTLGAGPDAQALREARALAEREARLAQRLVDERLALEAERSVQARAAPRPSRRSTERGDTRRDEALTRRPLQNSDTEPPPRESRRARVPRTTVAANAAPPSGR